MRYKYVPGQVVRYGPFKVTIEEQREFWGNPSYLVCWFDKNKELYKAVVKESEIT